MAKRINRVEFMNILILFSAVSVWAATTTGTLSGPASGALGGAGRAGVSVSDGGHLNPAMLVHQSGYHIIGLYDTAEVGHQSTYQFGGMVTDSVDSSLFPA